MMKCFEPELNKVVTIKTPPKIKKPKQDPNLIKFNVTEMIKNRTDKTTSIVMSSAKKRVQSEANQIKLEFTARKNENRNKHGFMTAINGKNITEDNIN